MATAEPLHKKRQRVQTPLSSTLHKVCSIHMLGDEKIKDIVRTVGGALIDVSKKAELCLTTPLKISWGGRRIQEMLFGQRSCHQLLRIIFAPTICFSEQNTLCDTYSHHTTSFTHCVWWRREGYKKAYQPFLCAVLWCGQVMHQGSTV